jgi:hypothetical protein
MLWMFEVNWDMFPDWEKGNNIAITVYYFGGHMQILKHGMNSESMYATFKTVNKIHPIYDKPFSGESRIF